MRSRTDKVYRAAGGALAVSFVLQAALGAWFFKTSILSVYLTELLLVLIALALLFVGLRIRESPWLFWFGALAGVHLVLSFLADREAYWVIRQGTFVLYLTSGVVFFVIARYGLWSERQVEAYWRAAFWIGLVLLVFHRVTEELVPGNPSYAATLLLGLGLAFHLERIPHKAGRLAFGIAVALVVANTVYSVSFPATVLAVTALSVTPRSRRGLVALGAAGALALIVLGTKLSQLNDANATWRYKVWTAVLVDSLDVGRLLLGRGFGIQYIPDSTADFRDIFFQVSNVWDPEAVAYQLMTVPPHNSVLEVLLYLGLPGVAFFLYPYAKSMVVGFHARRGDFIRVIALQLTVVYMISLATQGVSVPYVAPFMWAIAGMAMGILARRREARRSSASLDKPPPDSKDRSR